MHLFDIILLVVGSLFAIIGIKRGLIGEAIRLIAVVAGFGVAALFYRQGYGWFEWIRVADQTRVVISFFALFLMTMAAVMAIGWLVRKIIHLTPLGLLDRLLGGGIGFCKVLVLAWIFVLSVESSPFAAQRRSLEMSLSYRMLASLPLELTVPYITTTSHSVEKLIQNDALSKIRSTRAKIDDLREKADSIKALQKGISRP